MNSSQAELEHAKATALAQQLAGLQEILAKTEAAAEAEENDAALGAADAAQRARKFRDLADAQRQKLADVRAAWVKAAERAASALRQEKEAEDLARRRKVPGLVEAYMAQVARVKAGASGFATAIMQLDDLGNLLAEALGTPEARRVMSLPALTDRLHNCLDRLVNPDRLRRVFPYPINPASSSLKRDLSDVSRELLDYLEPSHATQASARAAILRIDPTGRSWFAIKDKDDDLWRVVPGKLKGEAAT